MPRQFKVYVDMDGVLCDWESAVRALGPGPAAGIGDAPEEAQQVMYKAIDAAGADFWANIPWTADGKELWSYVSQFNPVILSSPGKFRHAIEGKNQWIKKHIPGTSAFFSDEKWEYAQPRSILIDDKPENIGAWDKFRGIGILHTDAESTKKKLFEAIKKISPSRAEKIYLSEILRGLLPKEGSVKKASIANFIRGLVLAFQKHHVHDFVEIEEKLEDGPIKNLLGKIIRLKPENDVELYDLYEKIRDEIYKLDETKKAELTSLILDPILYTLRRLPHIDTTQRAPLLNRFLGGK